MTILDGTNPGIQGELKRLVRKAARCQKCANRYLSFSYGDAKRNRRIFYWSGQLHRWRARIHVIKYNTQSEKK